jgi:hypothetical protein
MGTVNLKTASGGSVILSPANTAVDVTITVPASNSTMAVNGPCFSAYASGTQTPAANTDVKFSFNTKLFDTASAYDATTNYRFTPQVAGYYQITAAITWNTSATASYIATTLKKNGVSIISLGVPQNSITQVAPLVTALVYLNGTTDYVEVWVANGAGTFTSMSSATGTYFQAAMVRSA